MIEHSMKLRGILPATRRIRAQMWAVGRLMIPRDKTDATGHDRQGRRQAAACTADPRLPWPKAARVAASRTLTATGTAAPAPAPATRM